LVFSQYDRSSAGEFAFEFSGSDNKYAILSCANNAYVTVAEDGHLVATSPDPKSLFQLSNDSADGPSSFTFTVDSKTVWLSNDWYLTISTSDGDVTLEEVTMEGPPTFPQFLRFVPL
jgi:hypothetical protein